jgi:hypothetical protein
MSLLPDFFTNTCEGCLMVGRQVASDESHCIVYPFVRFSGTDGVVGVDFVAEMNNTFVDQVRYGLAGIRRINI